jgi:hypothetical protein
LHRGKSRLHLACDYRCGISTYLSSGKAGYHYVVLSDLAERVDVGVSGVLG